MWGIYRRALAFAFGCCAASSVRGKRPRQMAGAAEAEGVEGLAESVAQAVGWLCNPLRDLRQTPQCFWPLGVRLVTS